MLLNATPFLFPHKTPVMWSGCIVESKVTHFVNKSKEKEQRKRDLDKKEKAAMLKKMSF